jgi:hypothetical protein
LNGIGASIGYIYGEYRGSTEHPLVEPIGTTLDGFGNVLVTDTGTNTIQTISIKDRQFIAEFIICIAGLPNGGQIP